MVKEKMNYLLKENGKRTNLLPRRRKYMIRITEKPLSCIRIIGNTAGDSVKEDKLIR